MTPRYEIAPAALLRRLKTAHELGIVLSDQLFAEQYPTEPLKNTPIPERELTLVGKRVPCSLRGAEEIILDSIGYTEDSGMPYATFDLIKGGKNYKITEAERQPTNSWYCLYTSGEGQPSLVNTFYLDKASLLCESGSPYSHEVYAKAKQLFGENIVHELDDSDCQELVRVLDTYIHNPTPRVTPTSYNR